MGPFFLRTEHPDPGGVELNQTRTKLRSEGQDRHIYAHSLHHKPKPDGSAHPCLCPGMPKLPTPHIC